MIVISLFIQLFIDFLQIYPKKPAFKKKNIEICEGAYRFQ